MLMLFCYGNTIRQHTQTHAARRAADLLVLTGAQEVTIRHWKRRGASVFLGVAMLDTKTVVTSKTDGQFLDTVKDENIRRGILVGK